MLTVIYSSCFWIKSKFPTLAFKYTHYGFMRTLQSRLLNLWNHFIAWIWDLCPSVCFGVFPCCSSTFLPCDFWSSSHLLETIQCAPFSKVSFLISESWWDFFPPFFWTLLVLWTFHSMHSALCYRLCVAWLMLPTRHSISLHVIFSPENSGSYIPTSHPKYFHLWGRIVRSLTFSFRFYRENSVLVSCILTAQSLLIQLWSGFYPHQSFAVSSLMLFLSHPLPICMDSLTLILDVTFLHFSMMTDHLPC